MKPQENSWVVRKIGYGATSVILAALGVVMLVIAGDWENLSSGIVLLVGAISSAVATMNTNKDSDVSATSVLERLATKAANRAVEQAFSNPAGAETQEIPTGMAGYYAQQDNV